MELTLALAEQVVADLLGLPVSALTRLHGSDRSLVARARLGDGSSVIVKLHDGGGPSVVREPAGLEVAGRPRVLAVSSSPPGLVMEDLGTGESLAEPLLGTDPSVATSRVISWAEALARTQVPGDGFADALRRHAQRLGTPVPAADGMPGLLRACADALEAVLAELGLRPGSQALEELRDLDDLLGGDVRRLSPTDTCPDNCLWLGDSYLLLDYESAQLRHVAWDVAYLQVPFPTCWCSWALPADLADAALATWRRTFSDRYVDSAAFDEDLRVARLGWAFITCWWFLSRALTGDEEDEPDYPQPRFRARLLHRFADAPEVAGAPALSALAQQIHHAMAGRWGAVPLELAPAFRGR